MSHTRLALAALLASVCAAMAQAPATAPGTPETLKGTTIASHPLASYEPVSDATLRHPDPADWLMMRGNYQGWGFSTLKGL